MSDRLYPLLPAIYRLRDTAEGEPLRALLAVVESELRLLEGDISDLYENWFIETCAEWAVPYIGDLLDTGELYADSRTYGQQERRAYVANTLAYRRRKGTTPVLEQLVRDVTGWRSRAVEFFQLLATTQNLSHPRPGSTTVDLRANRQPDRIGTPFEQRVAYLAEVRRIRSDRTADDRATGTAAGDLRTGGRYNVPNVGLFVWRLQSYPIDRSLARRVAGVDSQLSGRCYTFSPLGFDRAPLFNQPQTETDILQLAQEIHLPGILRRSELIQELESRRRSALQGQPLEGIRYFDSDPVLQIFVNRQPRPIPPDEILIAPLRADSANGSDWQLPKGTESLPSKTVAVDPESGRLAFLGRTLPQTVEVSYLYGFSGDVGGGSYEREVSEGMPSNPLLSWTITQAVSADANPLRVAVQQWNRLMQVWQGLRDRRCVPLAQITLPAAPVVHLTETPLPQFIPGIVAGLQVIASRGATSAIVTPGVAVDRQGRRLSLGGNQTIALQPVRDETGTVIQPEHLLVISYRSAQTGATWQLDLLPAGVSYPRGSFIPLARLIWDGQQFGLPDEQVRSDFVPGIVAGLQVLPQPDLSVVITTGTAIDRYGQPIQIAANQRFDLRSAQAQQRQFGILIAGGDWKFALLDPIEPVADRNFILLATLEIPLITIDRIDVGARAALPKGTIKGLEVSLSGRSQITLTPGQAIDASGRPIRIDSTCQIDLSAFPGQTLVLFVCDREEIGLPGLKVTPSRRLEEAWRQIGVIPLEPPHADIGQITIGDNGTYSGSLSILLPPGKRLQIKAASGYRPHLQGNFSVQAYIAPAPLPPNTLHLEGLLIEGKLVVQPGQLQRLAIDHCTLLYPIGSASSASLTATSSLIVRKTQPTPIESESDENPLLMALILYLFMLIQRILRLGSGSDFATPSQNLLQLTLLATQQLQHLWTLVQRSLGWRCAADPSDEEAEDTDAADRFEDWFCFADSPANHACSNHSRSNQAIGADNDQLKITLTRSICGTIQLTNTVPLLEIRDSMIDSQREESSREAIVAGGTDLQIHTSTILGSTLVRSLEASDCLFTHKLISQRQQVGCLRFCYVPDGSQTPQRYQCQPDKTLAATLDVLPQKVRALAITSLPGTGTIASQDRTITGTDTRFPAELGIGSLITAADQTRTVIAIDATQTRLTIDRPFSSDLLPETAFSLTQVFAGSSGGLFRFAYHPDHGNQWQDISQTLGNRNVTALLVQSIPNGIRLWAGTAGGGLFHTTNYTTDSGTTWTALNLSAGTDDPINTKVIAILESPVGLLVGTAGQGVLYSPDGITWQPLNQGLAENLNLTALVLSPDNRVFAGGSGGVFQLDPEAKLWTSLNDGLNQRSITALAIDGNQQIFAATPDGIFRRAIGQDPDYRADSSPSCREWVLIQPDLQAIALAVHPVSSNGTLSSSGTIATGTETQFDSGWVGYTLSAINQTKTITAVQSASGLSLDSPFCPDLPPETPFRLNNWLFAATNDGNLFRSIDNGDHWTRIPIDSSSPVDISALRLDRTHLWLGTGAGNVLQAIDLFNGGSWRSLNQGMPNLEEKLLILNRLIPRFTSKTYGDPGYCQLSRDCATELYQGAEDGAEMGVFNFLKQPQRETNLQASLAEYLRFGLEAGVFYVT
ncbi:hypothetical protein [Leptolyngbya ohadii]|uniref:hypothetical protein n=1 Tax=Leptolyngbya ohadii TaxID=1962290 RepID=UPI000B5A1110|nr:hypothetical protein [Leptolyngbya ohadii]